MNSRCNANMTKRKKFIIVTAFLCFMVILASTFILQNNLSSKLLYSQEYVAGKGNIKGNVNIESFLERSECFDIGANSYGYAVFKDPNAAFTVFIDLYSEGIELVQKEFNLDPLTETNYNAYMQYAFLMAGDSKAEKQARFIPEFLDIYENSFTLP